MHYPGKILSTTLLLSTALTPAAADETLNPVIVTASRTAQTVDEALAPVIVIGREEIERSQAFDVAELLRFHAGLDVARTGGPGGQTSVFIRGTESDHVLLLIDGVKFNSGTIGIPAYERIDPDSIERIEIVKGPRSTLYGSEAIGGVINIITRRAEQGTNVDGSVGFGSHGTRRFGAGFNHATKNWRVGFSAKVNRTDGIPADRVGTLDRAFENRNINAFAGITLKGGTDIELTHYLADGNSEFLNFGFPADQDFQNTVTALTVKTDFTSNWASTFKLSRLVDDLRQNQNSGFARTERDVFDWQNDIEINANNLVTTGITLSREDTEASGFSTFDEDTDIDAFYLQDNITFGRHQLLLAGRHTDHETFGTENTWNVEYGLQATSNLRLLAGVGTAFRAPNSTDRFGSGGDPDLNPETSQNTELGLRYKISSKQNINLSAYHNKIEDLISFTFNPATNTFVAANIRETKIKGIELGWSYNSGPWHLNAEANFQKARDEDTGRRLLRRSDRSFTASGQYITKSYSLGADLLNVGDREDFRNVSPFNRDNDVGGYTLVNLTAAKFIDKNLSLRAKVENLFDKDYETVRDFNAPDRSFFVELRYNFNE